MLQKNTTNFLDVNIDNIVTRKLVKTKTKNEYLSGYLDAVIRLVLILPIRFKIKDGDKDTNNKFVINNK